MINKISSLVDIGGLQNFFWEKDAPDFVKRNIIYGYNGSGKTTLSNIFRLYSEKEKDGGSKLFSEISSSNKASVEVVVDSRKVKFKQSCKKKNIYAFNSDFVSEHVYNGSTSMFKEFDSAVVTKEQLSNPSIKRIELNIQNQKTALQELETKKTEFKNRWKDIRQKLSDELNKKVKGARMPPLKEPPSAGPVKSASEFAEFLEKTYDQYAISEKGSEKSRDINAIESALVEVISIDFSDIEDSLLESLMATSRQKIEGRIESFANYKLLKEGSLEDWFEEGHSLLKDVQHKEESNCPLCSSEIKLSLANLINEYDSYFSEEFKKLTRKITNGIKELSSVEELLEQNQRNAIFISQMSVTDLLGLN